MSTLTMCTSRFEPPKALQRLVLGGAALLLVLTGVSPQKTKAQYINRWIAIGSVHTQWSQLGLWSHQNYPRTGSPMWDGMQIESGWGEKTRFQLITKTLTSPSGGPPPNILNIPFSAKNPQQFWPKLPFKVVSKRPKPIVKVNGLRTFQRNQTIDEVDPSLSTDRMFVATVGTWMGVDVQTKVYASSLEPYDDYYLVETTYTNTGDTDPNKEGAEEERTLDSLYVGRRRKMAGFPRLGGDATWGGYKWGGGTDSDRTWEDWDNYDSDIYDVDFTSVYAWAGPTSKFSKWDEKGFPILRKNTSQIASWDTLGRLAGGGMMGMAKLYAPKRALGPNETPKDVPDAGASQPTALRHQFNVNPDEGGNAPFFGLNAYDEAAPIPKGSWQAERQCPPGEYPDAKTWEQRMAVCDGDNLKPGANILMGYGPYTLKPGEKITTVEVVSVSGLSKDARFKIGRQYKRNWEDFKGDAPIDYDANGDGEITDTALDGDWGDEHMSKNMWVMSSRDSLFETFRRARTAWKQGSRPQTVPQRPVHPASFSVDTRADKIQLTWNLYDDAPVPDSFAVYRTDVSFRTLHEHVATVEAKAGKREYSYADTGVERGVGYYYYLQAIDQTERAAGGVPKGTTLRSNRYMTQSYAPARLVQSPGEQLSEARVVPNPLNVNASESVRFPGQNGNKVAFLDIPGQATIEIYTELGELVRTINHTSGSGDEAWNLTTDSNQVVQSGIYLAVIKDRETGKQVIRRFVIMR